MKKLSLLLAVVMMFSCLSGAFAEGTPAPASAADVINAANASADSEAAAAAAAELEKNCEYSVIEASGEQVRLTYIEGVTPILEQDGLKFKDLNNNGTLDVYEDWRKDTDTRIADLIAQMTPAEEVGLLFCVNTQLVDAVDRIKEFGLTCQLFNLNGTPITITNTLNNLQAAAEAERLGVPMVFTSDREYNSFGGYIDKSHEAFGTADDPELAYQLASFYGKAMTAIGVQVTFEPYAEEIGAQYGENPQLIAGVVHEEIRGLEENGLASCTKHWIGRGGDSSFGKARSVAQNFDNWMVGWKAALSAGSEWVMTNCGGTGITNTVDVKWDKTTMSYLRNTLGFKGVVVSDWWALGGGPNNPGRMSGITAEGVDLSQKTIGWLYNDALANGTDMFGSGSIVHDYSAWESSPSSNYPDAIIDGLASGEVEKANVDQAATRILRFKFSKGLFEDPYNNVDDAVKICASAEWAANPTDITSDEELRAARNPEEVALTEKLQAESAVLVKNNNNLLPLTQGIKVYVTASNTAAMDGYKKYIANYATVVETMEEADIVIGDFGKVNDAAEQFIDDAHDSGKPIVLTLNTTDPTQYAIENADALIYMSYSQRADHGSSEAGFVSTTAPWVYADMLFGTVAPGGVIVKEIARDSFKDQEQWKDLAGDQGASPYVRLMVQATMMQDTENHASPNNWGDPLVQALYGMKYGENPDFAYSCLILPIVQTEKEEEDSSGNKSMVVYSSQAAKAGEPFTVYCLLNNNGADGITTVQVLDGETVVAEKIMTVTAGSWRVVEMEVTLDTAGEHTLSVGGLSGVITITE